MFAKLSPDQRLEQDAERVQRGPDAGQDEGDCEHLAGRGQRPDLAKADRRDGGDRLVERFEDAETEHDVPDRSDDEHSAESEQRQPEPTQLAHPLIIPREYRSEPPRVRGGSEPTRRGSSILTGQPEGSVRRA